MSTSPLKAGEAARGGRRRVESRVLMALGALIAGTGIVWGYFYPGTPKPIETVKGTIVSSQIVIAGPRDFVRNQTVGVKLTVLYTVDGKQGSLSESVTAGVAVAGQIYGVGAPITVYVRRDKYGVYATLSGPGAPRAVMWTTVTLFGAAWVVLGWFIGRPTDREVGRKARERE